MKSIGDIIQQFRDRHALGAFLPSRDAGMQASSLIRAGVGGRIFWGSSLDDFENLGKYRQIRGDLPPESRE
jgi:hypothetical protein